MKNKKIVVLEGGYNEEHEISIATSEEIKKALIELNHNVETVVVNPKEDSKLMQEETFGPVVSISSFTNENLSLAIIHIVRDPRDVAISYSKFFGISFDKSIERMIANKLSFIMDKEDPLNIEIVGSWKFHYNSWKTGIPNIPRITIRYEDLIDNTLLEIQYEPFTNFFGNDLIEYRVYDGVDYSNTSPINIVVNPINDAPILSSIDDQEVNEDEVFVYELSATDVDDTDLSYSATVDGNASVDVTGSTLTVTPDLNYNGSDSFSFTASDSELNDMRFLEPLVISDIRNSVTNF